MHRMPVVDADSRVIGIVTHSDLIRSLVPAAVRQRRGVAERCLSLRPAFVQTEFIRLT
ncbi:CBS domain-containing protein [Sinorhizobium terangae]|uniref:CBS domain-containing protein n=2 Tax=Sinorhizobium terangae TaxID=110322 RepID=UPI00307E59F1